MPQIIKQFHISTNLIPCQNTSEIAKPTLQKQPTMRKVNDYEYILQELQDKHFGKLYVPPRGTSYIEALTNS
jgi:hypothetical protein